MSGTKVLIIGGGISGLSTAWWLARRGIGVEVWEAGERPGGKIRTTREQGYLTERAAGLLVNHRPEIDRLIVESGLEAGKSLQPHDLNRYVLQQGQLTRVPMKAPALMASNLWSWRTKLRLMSEILIPRGNHESETVADFITRHPGQLDQDDMTMTENVLSGLSPLMGIRGLPDYVRVNRHPRGLPLYHGDYPARIERIRCCLDRLPGLYLNANYIDGVSVRERIFQGMRTADELARQIGSRESELHEAGRARHPAFPSSATAPGVALPPAPQGHFLRAHPCSRQHRLQVRRTP